MGNHEAAIQQQSQENQSRSDLFQTSARHKFLTRHILPQEQQQQDTMAHLSIVPVNLSHANDAHIQPAVVVQWWWSTYSCCC